MRNARTLLALAALALLAAGVVSAATSVQNGQSTRGVQQIDLVGGIKDADSTGQVLRFDANGNLLMSESAPPQTFLIKHTNILQGSLWRVQQCQAAPTTCTQVLPQADSSMALSTLGATRLALAIRYNLDADSACAALLCIEVRGHYAANVDSSNTFAWRWITNTTSTNPDTVGAMATTNTATTVGAFTNSSLDTTNIGLNERAVMLNSTSPFRSIFLPIYNRNTGEQFQAPYTSVRVRLLKVYGSTACTPWTGKAGPITSIQADLIGWR